MVNELLLFERTYKYRPNKLTCRFDFWIIIFVFMFNALTGIPLEGGLRATSRGKQEFFYCYAYIVRWTYSYEN